MQALRRFHFLILLLLFLMNFAQAEDQTWLPDLRVGLLGRTHPIGGQLVGQAGIGAPIWGDTNTWKYGYFRVAANLAASAVVNRAGAEVQLFPISILGFSAGYDIDGRNYIPNYIDCTVYQCSGQSDRKFLKAVLVGASHGFVFSMLGKYERVRAFDSYKPFFDEITLVTGKSSGEDIVTMNPAVLYTLDSEYKVGVTTLFSHALSSGDTSNLWGPVVNFASGPNWSGVVGGGWNGGTQFHTAMTAFFTIQYLISPGLNVAEMPLRERKLTPIFSADR